MGCKPCKKTSIGGQALIEGIMMRGPHRSVMACRMPDGTISVEEVQINSVTKKHKILGLPVIRGAVNLIESMVVGYKTMMMSAEKTGMLDELDDKQKDEVEESVAEPIEEAEAEENAEAETEELVDAEAEEVAEEAESEETEKDETEESAEEPAEEAAEEITEETAEEPVEEEPKKKGDGLLMGVVSILSTVLGVDNLFRA